MGGKGGWGERSGPLLFTKMEEKEEEGGEREGRGKEAGGRLQVCVFL